MVDESVKQVVELLERLARETEFDEAAYLSFGLLLKGRKVDPLLGAAYDEATEFYVTWKHRGKELRTDTHLNDEVTRESREHLLLFARALRSDAKGFSSLDELKERMQRMGPS